MQLLLQKLKQFTRKYYLNQMLKGALLAGAFLFSSFIVVVLFEHFGYYSSIVRASLFYGFVGINAIILVKYLVVPLLKLYQIRPGINNKQAAEIIGKHFTEVADSLTNALELFESSSSKSTIVSPLILASIEQRTKHLSPIPFQQVIKYNENKRYIKWVGLPILAILLILFISPKIITGSTQRLVQYNKTFEPESPFKFVLLNQDLSVMQATDVAVKLKITGDYLPNQAYIEYNGSRYMLEKINKNQFVYTFRNIQSNTKFQFSADGYTSKNHQITVYPKASIQGFSIKLNYPSYINKKSDVFDNQGNLIIPDGTKIEWNINGKNANVLQFVLNDSMLPINALSNGSFKFNKVVRNSFNYLLIGQNQYGISTDTIRYQIGVIPDAFPQLKVSQNLDTANNKNVFFVVDAADDYGITKLSFFYKIANEEGIEISKPIEQNIPINNITQSIYHFFDINTVELKPGYQLSYFFEVTDNDAINGRKKTISDVFTYRMPSIDEMKEQQSENAELIKSLLKQSISDARSLQQESQKLKRKLQDQQSLSWDDKKQIKDLLDKEKALENNLKEILEKNKENLEQKDKFNQIDKDLLEKQKQIQDMAEKLLSDDLKKLIDDLQKLMEKELNKDKTQQKLDQMEISNKDVEKELDRMMEFFKQLELEEKANKASDKLDELAKKLDDLANELKDEKNSNKGIEKQEDLNKEFDDLKKDLEDLKKDNKDLDSPLDFDDLDKEEQEADKNMDQATDDLQKQQPKKASQKQKNASENMKKMAKNMRMQMQQGQMQQMEEDVQALRMLLENLLKFSFNQESLMDRLIDNSSYSPIYIKLGQEQQKLKDDARLIEDSLFALSKRVMQIQSFINKEVGDLNSNLDKALRSFSDRNTRDVKTRQQYAMMHANNLALMLSETLNQMQQQMQQAKGNMSCTKPGNGKPSFGKMSQMQKQLNQQMQKMQQQMGQNPDGKDKGKQKGNKSGEQSGGESGEGGTQSSEFAKMVAQQEAIRRELNRLQEEFRKQGLGAQGDLDNLSKEMEKTEKQLLNKNLTFDMINRQEEILTRLLESEKAQREREEDQKRESEIAKKQEPFNSAAFEQFQKKRQKELELLRTNNPAFNDFYKEKINAYFNQIAP